MFGAVQAVKVARPSSARCADFDRLNEVRRRAALKDRLFGELLRSVSVNMASIGIGVVLLLGRERDRPRFTVGDFALFVAYLDAHDPAAVEFVGAGRRPAQAGRASRIDRLVELLAGAPPGALVSARPIYVASGRQPLGRRSSAGPTDRLDRLEVRGLTYRHPDDRPRRRGVDLRRLERGSLTVITGRIGAGKTTLLRRPARACCRATAGESAGTARLVDDPASFFVPPRGAYTPQVPRLFSETLRDNVLLGPPDDGRLERRAPLGRARARPRRRFGGGLETLVGPRGVRALRRPGPARRRRAHVRARARAAGLRRPLQRARRRDRGAAVGAALRAART